MLDRDKYKVLIVIFVLINVMFYSGLLSVDHQHGNQPDLSFHGLWNHQP
jgi:hypothetical protein